VTLERFRPNAFLRLFASLFLALLLLPGAAEAKVTELSLTPCVRMVALGDTAESIARQTTGFDCQARQNQLPSGDYWVKMDPGGVTGDVSDPLKLRSTSVWNDGQEIHAFYADGTHYSLAVPNHDVKNYLHLGARLEFPLAVTTQPVRTIVVRIHNSANIRGAILAPELVSTSESARDERNLAALYAAFGGLCLALFVYNLALWRGMRSPFQLAYGAMVLTLLAYAFTSSGAACLVFPDLGNQDRLRLNYLFLSLAAATAVVFLRHFMEANVLPRWFIRACWAQAALVMTTGVSFALLAPTAIHILDYAYFASFLPLPAFFLLTIWHGHRNGSKFVAYVMFAWSAPVAVAFARSLHGVGLIPYNFWLDNGSLIAMALEAMISSMAIGQRVRQIARDRDWARSTAEVASDLADKDALTGLLNRRSFLRHLLEEPREWQLVLVDIDHFKRVNDTLGHADGDEVLIKIAQALRDGSRETSLVARLGGEEFAIATIAPFNSPGLVDPEKLLAAIRKVAMPGGYRVTASIGVARRTICEEMDWKILYRAADMALYRAKAEGRDRHVDYSAERIAA
jgi:diguanylate cyclase (GGDEF)-like protein